MRLFGLIGYPLSHSFSAKYFTAKFEKEDITECSYELFPLRTIDELSFLLRDQPGLEGFNITVPYKKQVMRFLDESRVPDGLDACNCVNINGGKLTGYNTDITGFEISLKPLLRAHHKKALILGNGGATLAVAFVLRKFGIDFTIVSRTPEGPILGYSAITGKIMKEHTLIINTTPLGQYPGENSCPAIPYGSVSDKHLLYDLVYNPAKTLFLVKGEERGAVIKNGEEMLILQAEESWRIWNQ
ncbi:MAG: shikimate dehydrogenase [Chitinophagaceae bacterium]